MSKRLSSSATFNALAERVLSLESRPLSSADVETALGYKPFDSFGGQIGDASFEILIEAGNPTIRFDDGDGIVYNRVANVFLFYVGGTIVATIP